jgi:cell division protein FtsW (lipid II flippase)
LKQLAAVILGLFLYILLSLVLRNLHLAVKLRWPAAAAASALLAFNILFGQRIFGAKNWIAIGPISFQPSEFVKLAFILAGAATLDRLFAKRNLIFTVLFSAYCVGCLALMSDFGTALIFFVAFLCIAFLRTGDLPSIVMMTAAAAFGGGIVIHFKPYIAERFTVWRHAWEYTQSTGYQQSRTMSAIAGGGLFGAGPEDSWLKQVGAANTDLVFGVVSEEFGFLTALCAVGALVILAVFVLESAAAARSSFYTIASCAAAAMLIFQTTLNVLGSVDLLPLTGVTFPFVSTGGSSMAACWGLLAFLKAADTRQNASFILRLPKKVPTPVPIPPESADMQADPSSSTEGFFADMPDIPVDDIFGKGGDAE